MHFIAHLGLAATLFEDLQNDEAARGAHWLGDITHRHGAQQAIERRRQLSGLAPAHVTTFQCGFAGGLGDCQLTEVSALLELLVNRIGLFGCILNRVGVGAFRRRNQDVGQVELFRQLHFAQVRRQEVLHFLLGDLNAFGNPTLAYTADDHFAANLLTCVVVGQAVASQGGAELLDRHVVALGNGADSLVQLFIGNADAGTLADLQLQVFDDQALKYLLLQHAGRRHGRATLGNGLLNFMNPLVQLALHDHVVVDDGHHFIDGLYGGARRRTQEQRAQHQRAQTIRKLGLHVHDNLGCLCRGSSLPWRR
ncbi:hypothetical protein D3C78_784990 [compost metagenome]